MDILAILLTVVIIAISILIVLIVLLQRPKQEGLGAAFGGSTLDGALGAQTTDVLQKTTTVFAVIFFVCAISLTMIKTRQFKNEGSGKLLDKMEKKELELPTALPGISAPIDPAAPIQVTKPVETKPAAKDAKATDAPKKAEPKKVDAKKDTPKKAEKPADVPKKDAPKKVEAKKPAKPADTPKSE